MSKNSVYIIGAGPSGLAVAARLRKANIDFTILEESDRIANSWHNHYDRLHLHTVKQWSHLPFVKFPDDYPTYVSKQQLIRYYNDYASKFEIKPIFNTKVTGIYKLDNGEWNVVCGNGKEYNARAVVIATGVNRVFNHIKIENQELYNGEVIPSFVYKNARPFIGKKVLVVGMGNTGAEIALDLAENKVDTFLSVRSPVNIVPRDLNGRPVQVTSKALAKLPFGIGIWLGTQIRKAYIGNLKKFGIETPSIGPTKQLLETGKTPVLDIGTVKAIKDGIIKVYGEIESFTTSGITFISGKHLEVDKVILCTGYRAQIEEIIEEGVTLLDKYGCPGPPIGIGFHKGLYFVGFDNYKLGGILGIIIEESETIVQHISEAFVKK